MAQRNMLCTHQTIDLEMEPGQTHLHPELNILLGNTIDLTNPSTHPVCSASRSIANVDPRHLSVPILNVGGATLSTYNPYMIPSSTSIIFPMPLNHGSSDHVPFSSNQGVIGVGIDEYGRNNFMDNIRGSCKRKNVEVVPGSYHYVNGSSSSSSLGVPINSGPQHRDGPFEPVLSTVTSTPSEYRGSGVLSITEGSQRSVRSRANAISLHLDSALAYHHNLILQGNYMGRSIQPVSNAWLEQFGSNGGDASSSNWNYATHMHYLHGRSVSEGLLEIGNMSGQGYQDTVSSSNSAIILHPSSMHHHHNHHPSLPMQGMQVLNYSFHPQLLAPYYRSPMNRNLHHCTISSSRDGLESASRYPRPFPSGWDTIYRSHMRLSQSASDEINGRRRLLSSEDVAIVEFPGFYGVRNFIDQHRDMRLDIDDMSYEELLALEERIGNVKTGLSEETISKCLRTRMHASCTSSSSLDQSSGMVHENMNCTICQVEYEEDEKVGILECGHDYHADCIKQWLLLKNLCPICKTTALSTDN